MALTEEYRAIFAEATRLVKSLRLCDIAIPSPVLIAVDGELRRLDILEALAVASEELEKALGPALASAHGRIRPEVAAWREKLAAVRLAKEASG